LSGLDFAKGPSFELLLAGKTIDELKLFTKTLTENFIPNKVVLCVTENNFEELKKLTPFIANYSFDFSNAQAYVCRNFACELPVDSPDEMMELMSSNV
jgi:uncharacterized protein YyaL (SSP411 family)